MSFFQKIKVGLFSVVAASILTAGSARAGDLFDPARDVPRTRTPEEQLTALDNHVLLMTSKKTGDQFLNANMGDGNIRVHVVQGKDGLMHQAYPANITMTQYDAMGGEYIGTVEGDVTKILIKTPKLRDDGVEYVMLYVGGEYADMKGANNGVMGGLKRYGEEPIGFAPNNDQATFAQVFSAKVINGADLVETIANKNLMESQQKPAPAMGNAKRPTTTAPTYKGPLPPTAQ